MVRQLARLCRLLMACCLLCLTLSGAAAAGESVLVHIPALATGADCTAVLYNSHGQPIQLLTLEKDIGNAFILECNGLLQSRYTVSVSEKDTESVTYDRSMYIIQVSVYYGADGELLSAVVIERQSVDGTLGGKEGMIRFNNQTAQAPATPTPTAGPVITPTPVPGVTATPTPTPLPYENVFTFRKVWSGDYENSIDWVMYNSDGSVRSKLFNKYEVSQTEWRYEAYFQQEVDDCYIIEYVPEGYTVSYVNVGEYADVTDRCHNGGTIINRKVPQTGDEMPIGFHVVCIVAASVTLAMLALTRRRRSAD